MMHSAGENKSLLTLHAFPEFLFFAIHLLLECLCALSYFVVWTLIQLTCLCTELQNLITSYDQAKALYRKEQFSQCSHSKEDCAFLLLRSS